MSRITNSIRESICRKAINAAFKEREEAHAAQEHALGMEAYEAVIPAAERKAAAKMPENWLRMDGCLKFNANGWSVTLCVKPSVPVPQSPYCQPLGSVTGDLAERIQAHCTAIKERKEAKHRAEREMTGFLEQFRSIKQMREAWPEGEPFYAEFDVERKSAGVPAVRVAEINKMLGIKEAA
jgi:hypothetical protein